MWNNAGEEGEDEIQTHSKKFEFIFEKIPAREQSKVQFKLAWPAAQTILRFQGGEHGNAGFVDSPSQFASPAGQGKKERRTNNIVPVTVRTIHQSEGDSVMVNGNDIKMVVIVGIIQTVEVSSTKINYTIDDTTGVIEAVQWLQSESEYDDNAQKPLMEMTYCRIIATIKTQMGKKHAMILKIEPITDLNRLTTHLLEVIHDPLKLENINNKMNSSSLMDQSVNSGYQMPGRLAGATQGQMMHGNVSASAGGASSDHSSGLDGIKKMVFRYIQMSNEEAGVWRDNIYNTFSKNAPQQSLDDALEFLTNEGHIYSTIDDDHFKTTDGC